MLPPEVRRILEVIEMDRERHIKELKNANENEIKKLIKSAENEGETIKEKVLNEHKVRAELIKNKNLADVEIERRKRIIEFKAGITGGLEAAAVKRLKKNYYEKFFGMLLEKGIVEIGSENLEVVVSKEDAELAKKLLKKMRIKAKIKTMHIMGGCLVRSGRVAANYSIESILKRKKSQIEKKINEMFFSD